MEDFQMDETEIRTFPARVHRINDVERRESLMERLRATVMDDAILEEHPPFFLRAEISNSRLDAYFSHMHETSLRNYAADAAAGVAFQNSHKRAELPMGRSLTGEYLAGEPAKVMADFYTLPGLNLNGVETDHVIRGIRSGIVKDLSIGFYGGQETCDVCGNRYYSWDCNHLAGLRYEVEENGVVRQILATYTVHDARLAEVSAVYDGATPGASILKAERMVTAGEIGPNDIRILEERYRVKLPQPKRVFAGAETRDRSKGMELEEQIRTMFGLGKDDNILAHLETLTTDADGLRAKVAELEPLAADGRAYRSDLIESAMAEGVRGIGEGFNADTYRAILDTAPLATIRQMRDDWKALGDKRFGGGRQTADNAQPAKPQAEQPQRKRAHVPTGAFKA